MPGIVTGLEAMFGMDANGLKSGEFLLEYEEIERLEDYLNKQMDAGRPGLDAKPPPPLILTGSWAEYCEPAED